MANFKGGFAFNNEAAKVEVEQAPDGTLISCVNPVTGESLGGGNSKEVYEGTAADLLPFNMASAAIANELLAGNITIKTEFDLSAFSYPDTTILWSYKSEEAPILTTISATTSINGLYADIDWTSIDGVQHTRCSEMFVVTNGNKTELSDEYFANIPTVTTIYYHTMPE